MDRLNLVFSYYDNWLTHFSQTDQIIISSLILIFIVAQLFLFIKKGRWIFLILVIILLPGTWPLFKSLAKVIWFVIKFFITRIQGNI